MTPYILHHYSVLALAEVFAGLHVFRRILEPVLVFSLVQIFSSLAVLATLLPADVDCVVQADNNIRQVDTINMGNNFIAHSFDWLYAMKLFCTAIRINHTNLTLN